MFDILAWSDDDIWVTYTYKLEKKDNEQILCVYVWNIGSWQDQPIIISVNTLFLWDVVVQNDDDDIRRI